jgi:hypothetical protein
VGEKYLQRLRRSVRPVGHDEEARSNVANERRKFLARCYDMASVAFLERELAPDCRTASMCSLLRVRRSGYSEQTSGCHPPKNLLMSIS